jgi:hypothetical protein
MDLGRSSAAFERARWLAELATAIEDAERTLGQLRPTAIDGEEASALHRRVMAAKREIEDLRLGGWRAPVQELGSKWIKLSGV